MQQLKAGVKEWGLALTPDQLEAFESYYQQLIVWNERVNLTSITDYDEVQVKHFLDSLSCLQVLTSISLQPRCIDIGAGAGFPGLPLKIALPEIRVTLLESVRKKIQFLEHMVKELGLRDVQVIQGRAEELGRQAGHREGYDVALARAVAELSVLLEYALPLLKVDGIFVAQKGGEIEGEVEAAAAAMNLLGGCLKEVREVRLPGLDDARHLVVVEKVASTPQKFPRRVGIPAKRPLVDLGQ
jgi:16S rRNA (guanine527-N7)-methyltransferase